MSKTLNYKEASRLVQQTRVTMAEYPREACQSGIVHIGIGAFHKAHQALYCDDLLAKKGGDWGISAVSLRRPSTRDQLAKQEYLYTVLEKSWDAEQNILQHHYRIVQAVKQVLVAPENPSAVIDLLASPCTKIITITITEKGYYFNSATRRLDIEHPDIQHDIATPSHPRSMAGYLLAACSQRKNNGDKGFTVISCDNLSGNGDVTRESILALAEAQDDSQLKAWIKTELRFCSSMVDRIVPATTDIERRDINHYLGLSDYASVSCETFRQWVIEDNFLNERPAWDMVGALFVNDVTPYENIKLRLLNASHSAVAYLGHLLGYTYIHEAIADPDIKSFVSELMASLSKSLIIPKDFDLATYQLSIFQRFSNQAIAYRCMQVASDGSQKLFPRLLKPAEALLSQNHSLALIAVVIAVWIRFLEGIDEQGQSYDIVDSKATLLCKVSKMALNETLQTKAIIDNSELFSKSLIRDPSFVPDMIKALTLIHTHGIRTVINIHNSPILNTKA